MAEREHPDDLPAAGERLTVLGELLDVPRRYTAGDQVLCTFRLRVQRPKPGVPPSLRVVCGEAASTLSGCTPGAKLALSGWLESFVVVGGLGEPESDSPRRSVIGFWAEKVLIFEQLPVRR